MSYFKLKKIYIHIYTSFYFNKIKLMERKYSLNEVDDFISKYKNKKNLNINNNSQKNNKDIEKVLSNKKLYFINNKNKENSYKNNLINISTKEESKKKF